MAEFGYPQPPHSHYSMRTSTPSPKFSSCYGDKEPQASKFLLWIVGLKIAAYDIERTDGYICSMWLSGSRLLTHVKKTCVECGCFLFAPPPEVKFTWLSARAGSWWRAGCFGAPSRCVQLLPSTKSLNKSP